MSTFETVALGAAIAWMVVLTLLALALIRQLGLITVRLDRLTESGAPVEDGLEVGSSVPSEVMAALGMTADDARPCYVLIHSALCMACRELAEDLGRTQLPYPVTGLVSGGTEDLAAGMARLFPPNVEVLRDPVATEVIRHLRVETTPFVFELTRGRVSAKAAVRGVDHLARLMETSDYRPDRDVLATVEVNGSER